MSGIAVQMINKLLGNGPMGVALDAVGTLIDPDPPVAEAYAEMALRQGVVLDRAVIKARFHQSFRDDEEDEARGPLVTDEPTEHRRWRRIVANVLPEVADLARAFEELWTHFGRPDAWRCFPDVGPTLQALRERGVPVRIASNFDGRLRAVVRGLPELNWLSEVLVISSEVGYRKPHPEFYRAICASLALPPERILSVGDDEENDVLGAERAGLRGLLIDRRGCRAEAVTSLFSLAEWAARERS
jgi:putative hydrolase of the HAD superfamily